MYYAVMKQCRDELTTGGSPTVYLILSVEAVQVVNLQQKATGINQQNPAQSAS